MPVAYIISIMMEFLISKGLEIIFQSDSLLELTIIYLIIYLVSLNKRCNLYQTTHEIRSYS
jgi:hypothetical protein